MTDLPITPTVAAIPAGSKPAASDDSAASSEQAFGAVLARQFAGAAGANAAQLGLALSKLAATRAAPEQGAADVNLPASTLPADMLATLLAQHAIARNTQLDVDKPASSDDAQAVLAQQQAALAAAGMPTTMPVTNTQPSASTPEGNADSMAATLQPGSKTAAPLNPAQANTQAVTAATPQDKAAFSEALQALEPKGAAPVSSNAARVNNAADLPLPTPQPLLAPTTAHQPVNAMAPAAAAPLAIDTTVGQPGWGHEFSQKITWIATQRDQSAELHLNPPQLGPLDVVLKISGDQATALFASPHAAVREAIEQALPKLREMLADNGIMLGNATVNDQTNRKEQENFARPQYDSTGQAGVTTPDHQAENTATTTISRHNGLVDTFA